MRDKFEAPLVSVILPSFNREKLLPRAIISVLNQTYQSLELIIIDDGSTDNTEEIVKSFSDQRIRYYRQRHNKGGSAARNIGIKLAKGRLIAFQDSDDEWLPEKLEKQIRKFNEVGGDVGIICCGYEFINDKTNQVVSRSIPVEKGNVHKTMLINNYTGPLAVLMKADCFNKVGLFDETLPCCHDWDLWIRVSKYYKFDYVPDILAKAYIHGRQLSTNLEVKIKGKEGILEKYREEFTKEPLFYRKYLMGLYLQYAMVGDVKGRIHLMNVLRLYPFHLKGYVHLCFSLFVPWIYRKVLMPYYNKSKDGIKYYMTD
jgi:glycosyltransferase involved in cell wall biosynthesis